MQFCFDATRFGTGLDEAVKLAKDQGFSAIEYSFAPFAVGTKAKTKLDAKESKFLKSVLGVSESLGVEIACLNLDYCLVPEDKKSGKEFAFMIAKLAHVAQALHCRKISIFLAPGNNSHWLNSVEEQLNAISQELESNGVKLLIRLSTAPQFRGKSLKTWQAMEPQDWRDLMSVCPSAGLSFSPADCVWLGIDYLKILPGIATGIEHIEAHDIEIVRNVLNDSGIYGPLWWRYRLPGKGQVDWTQLVEALKLYDFKGTFSIHLDDEFIAGDHESLEEALKSSAKILAPLVKN
jgi:sugar phosphate isomerase/epimerase